MAINSRANYLSINSINKKEWTPEENSGPEQANEHRNKNSQSQEFFDYDFIHMRFSFQKRRTL